MVCGWFVLFLWLRMVSKMASQLILYVHKEEEFGKEKLVGWMGLCKTGLKRKEMNTQ